VSRLIRRRRRATDQTSAQSSPFRVLPSSRRSAGPLPPIVNNNHLQLRTVGAPRAAGVLRRPPGMNAA
jgi:hypothetical protein